jgi:hypothetical protein
LRIEIRIPAGYALMIPMRASQRVAVSEFANDISSGKKLNCLDLALTNKLAYA